MTIPVYCWDETWWRSFSFTYVCRTLVTLHGTWLVNSAAHMFGHRPFDPEIAPADNVFVNFYGYGEGYHNYHHTFPWDYKASETGAKVNMTRKFIEMNRRLGLAYDLKTASAELVGKVSMSSLRKSAWIVIDTCDCTSIDVRRFGWLIGGPLF